MLLPSHTCLSPTKTTLLLRSISNDVPFKPRTGCLPTKKDHPLLTYDLWASTAAIQGSKKRRKEIRGLGGACMLEGFILWLRLGYQDGGDLCSA